MLWNFWRKRKFYISILSSNKELNLGCLELNWCFRASQKQWAQPFCVKAAQPNINSTFLDNSIKVKQVESCLSGILLWKNDMRKMGQDITEVTKKINQHSYWMTPYFYRHNNSEQNWYFTTGFYQHLTIIEHFTNTECTSFLLCVCAPLQINLRVGSGNSSQ